MRSSLRSFQFNNRHSLFTIRAKRAFTLLEILVTMGIIITLASIAMPRIAGSLNNARVKGDTRKIVGTLRLARDYAVVSGHITAVEFHLEKDEYQFFVLDEYGEHLKLEKKYFDDENERAEHHLPRLSNELARPHKMAHHVYVSAVFSSAPLSAEEEFPQIMFFPDGSATAATLAIEDFKGKNRLSVEVYRSTGLAKVEKGMSPQLKPAPGKKLFYGPKKK